MSLYHGEYGFLCPVLWEQGCPCTMPSIWIYQVDQWRTGGRHECAQEPLGEYSHIEVTPAWENRHRAEKNFTGFFIIQGWEFLGILFTIVSSSFSGDAALAYGSVKRLLRCTAGPQINTSALWRYRYRRFFGVPFLLPQET